MILELYHPQVARRDCAHCQKFHYDEDTGLPVKDERGGAIGDGTHLYRRGPTPCRTAKGCPKGTPEDPATLNARNREAYRHYLECKAVGNFPGDSIVRRNAGIIRSIEESHRRLQAESTQQLLQAVVRAALAR